MFDRLKRKFAEHYGTRPEVGLGLEAGKPLSASASGPLTLRDSLFADTELDKLLGRLSSDAKSNPPFAIFAQAAEERNAGNKEKAVALLKGLTQGEESRVELYAWTALREFGEMPPPERAKEVLGVIVEVAMNGGEDMVAAYPEHTARYYNHAGGGVVWETDDPRLNLQIDALLEAGRKVAAMIGPWEGKRPDVPRANQVRLNMLTPSGLHFGEGDMNALSRDPMGGPMIKAAFELMQALIAVDLELRKDTKVE